MPETAFEAVLSLLLNLGQRYSAFWNSKGKTAFSGGFPADVFSCFVERSGAKETDIHPLT